MFKIKRSKNKQFYAVMIDIDNRLVTWRSSETYKRIEGVEKSIRSAMQAFPGATGCFIIYETEKIKKYCYMKPDGTIENYRDKEDFEQARLTVI